MKYDINRPWLSLDKWQKEYIFDKEDTDNFLLAGRQSGKTTAMSLRAVELCMNHYKKGEFVLINSITEKQAYHVLMKSLVYAKEVYNDKVVWKGKDKPTMHKIIFKNGTGILCYAAGEAGDGIRGYTIKKLMCDEGSRMSEEYFIAAMPMLSVIEGSMDIGSTPAGKNHKNGKEKFFYKCSKDEKFKKYYISSEDCPRHSKEFLESMRERMTKLAYAQEFLAQFTDELQRLISDELINKMCVIKKMDINWDKNSKKYIGVDVAGLGKDECTFESFEEIDGKYRQIGHLIEKRNYTTDTTKRILLLDTIFNYRKIGIDDGGVGFGVYSELIDNQKTRRRTIALNNSSRPTNSDGKGSKKILKEEMYLLFVTLAEQGRIKLIDCDEIRMSLASIQYEGHEIYGAYAHIVEGMIRAIYLAYQNKGLNIFAHTF